MIVFKSIKPGKKFQSSVFREKARFTAEKMAPKIEADFKKTTKTWNTKPEFKTAVKVGAAAGGTLTKRAAGFTTGVSLEVGTDSRIYLFLDEGTRVRYATMTTNFIAKTKPNILASYKGRGGLLFVNRKRKRPGIKARNWSKIIRKNWQPIFRAEMQKALNEGAKASGHGVNVK